jgi:hypothetical protein
MSLTYMLLGAITAASLLLAVAYLAALCPPAELL